MTFTGKEIFNLLQKKGAMPKSEISNITGIKLTTLNRIMKTLEDNKILVQYRIGESTGGRKPIVYNINLCSFYIIGIDISIGYVKIVFTNLKLDILHKQMFEIDYTFTPVKILDYIVELINETYEELNLQFLNLFGIGVSVPGSFDFKSGILYGYTAMWNIGEIKSILEYKLGDYVVIENGANAAATLEYFYGLKIKFNNMVYVECGEKLRTGIVVNGKIFRTFNNEEDSFGRMIVDRSQGNFENFRCVESYSSSKAIVENFIFQLKKGRNSIINKPVSEITCKDICEAAEINDGLSIEIIKNAAIVLAIGLINLIQMLDLKAILLNGEIILYSKMFYDTCVDTVLKKARLFDKNEIIFKKEVLLGKDEVAVGAAAMVIEKCIEN